MADGERSRDAELLRRFRAGDERAFRTLLEDCRAALTDRIRQCLPRQIDRKVSVSDVLQESCVVAYQRRESLEDRGPAAFRNWLLGIVEKKAREAVRHHLVIGKRSAGREVTRAKRLPTAEIPGRGPSPSQVAIGEEVREFARIAMDSLPEEYREVLRLAREEHLSLREAAKRMGRSREAVKKLYGRALFRFREVFEGLRGGANA